MNNERLYYKYSDFLKQKYGEKVYKLSINLPITCPNRDENNLGGCIFCADVGTGFSTPPSSLVLEQINMLKEKIYKRYKAKKYIAYFQNYTNTYLPIDKFKEYINKALVEDIVEIDISTRPDCISKEYLDFLKEVENKDNVNITIELGLQTVNYRSLNKLNRGHSLAEFIDCINLIKEYKFTVCTHIILNLPWDDLEDVIENAKVLSALKVDQVKLHSLYIMDNTKLGEMYKKGEIDIISMDEYKNRVIEFLEYLDPNIVIQRLVSRAPREDSLFVNWNRSWWVIRDEIVEDMLNLKTYQGRKFNYLGGKFVK